MSTHTSQWSELLWPATLNHGDALTKTMAILQSYLLIYYKIKTCDSEAQL